MADTKKSKSPEGNLGPARRGAVSAPQAKADGKSWAWKWWIAGVLFLATVLTYLDRQTVALCGPMLAADFNLKNEQFGELLAAFRWTYPYTHPGRLLGRSLSSPPDLRVSRRSLVALRSRRSFCLRCAPAAVHTRITGRR